MTIHYHCHHCGMKIGSIEKTSVHSESLGLHKLTDQERHDMITYDNSGDIFITSICEDCQEAFERNPEYHQYGFLIQ
ncbi:MAG TPA: anti-sigma-F factor Fin family protein [Bacillales bacterium]|nr:anti-sigma-F factor Fin family protein [Bacillales bacterium]